MKPVPLIFEISKQGRTGYSLPALDVPEAEDAIPEGMRRGDSPELPEVAEVDAVSHFTNLSNLNHGLDSGFYPLGSCTMKYNPKVDEDVAGLPGFTEGHPYQPESLSQGNLRLMYEMGKFLAEISGMDAVTLQPAAGAHGEFTGMSIIRAYHESRGNKKTKVIVPDSAHGTNPATSAMCGYKVVEVKSDDRGGVDIEKLREVLDDEVAAIMLTNPNTLGLFDENIEKITEMVHEAGGLCYYDGANLNGTMGMARPGDMGFDVVHINLHKTFSTPHGGGGPGSGPVGVKKQLAGFLPVPVVDYDGEKYYFNYDLPDTIGKVRSFYGNFGIAVRAYAYILSNGPDGLKKVCENAVLNANYLMENLKDLYYLPYDRPCKHEFVISGKLQNQQNGVKTMDIAKRLLDFGIHPPTVYFPLIVDEALMIEPTETESKETLDTFIAVMRQIAEEAGHDPELVKSAPHNTPVGRMDEAKAARHPVLKYEGQR